MIYEDISDPHRQTPIIKQCSAANIATPYRDILIIFITLSLSSLASSSYLAYCGKTS